MVEIDDQELAALKKRADDLEKELGKAHSERQTKDIEARLEQVKRDIRDEISSSHAQDRTFMDALQQQVNEALEFIADARKRADEDAKLSSSQSTIVIPPSDLGRQPPPSEEQSAAPTGPEGRKRSRWDWW